ncbi:MAG: YkgJ family cysteine cluster protein [Pirellulales bacterium]
MALPPRYDCDQCGACCRALIVEIDELDFVREPKLLTTVTPFKTHPDEVFVDDDDQPVAPLIPGYQAGGMLACGSARPCPMIDEANRCTIYATRPTVCLAFRAGSEQCQMARRMIGLPELVPLP